MPLSTPVSRQLLHKRVVYCNGYRRDDGLWDIEGHLIDTKTYDIQNQDRGGIIKTGDALHEMWLRLTLDQDFLVHEVEASTDWGPFNICGNIVERFKLLKGLTISPGWNRKVRELLGGVRGCTHLVELLGPIATTAFQTIYPARKPTSTNAEDERPIILNTCHALASDTDVVRVRWPQFYTGKKKANSSE